VGHAAGLDEPDPGTSWSELKDLVAQDKIEEVVFEGDWTVRAKKKGKADPPRSCRSCG